jgi:hypothetical protein
VVIIQKYIYSQIQMVRRAFWNYYRFLLSYNVVGGKFVLEKNFKDFNKRLKNCPLNILVIWGQISWGEREWYDSRLDLDFGIKISYRLVLRYWA